MATSDFLQKIVEHKKKIVEAKKKALAGLKKNVSSTSLTRYKIFKEEIARAGRINLIAEIKKASPSQGLIRKEFDLLDIARIYVENGATALSILTEEKYFLGKPVYIRQVASNFKLPILAKDFFIDEIQIYETFNYGSSAILLIAAILDNAQLRHLIHVATELDMDCLVEVHDELDLDRALSCGAEIIGVNNRDLKTFTVDLRVGERLIPQIPRGKVIVVESGIKSFSEVSRFRDMGAHAVLIGETFMRAPDMAQKMKEVMGSFLTR